MRTRMSWGENVSGRERDRNSNSGREGRVYHKICVKYERKIPNKNKNSLHLQ